MKFRSPKPEAVRLCDPVLAPRQAANRAATIPSSLDFCEKTHRIDALRLDWDESRDWRPHHFWDSDVAKVMEGMARALRIHPDPALARKLDGLVAVVAAAQRPDGYLNSFYMLTAPDKRWSNLRDMHELYCAGHLIEAAVAHFEATGSRVFLDAACRYADLIGSVFGRGRGKRRGYPGHEELELALCRLAATTGRAKYLRLAKYFIDERGRAPNYFEAEGSPVRHPLSDYQADAPVREQADAHGHAVRWAYLACGMADVADATGDAGLLEAALRMEKNATERRMLVTGGIGTSPWGDERFENDWHLRNKDAYAESCASIGLALLEKRLHAITGDARHVDVMERAIYNGVLSGVSLSGDRFFYQNPLESNADSRWPAQRQSWFACSCCPTNFCRFLPQLGELCWALAPDGSEVRLLVPAALTLDLDNGLRLVVESDYPYDGKITVRVEAPRGPRDSSDPRDPRDSRDSSRPSAPSLFALSLRIPGWCRRFALAVNGRRVRAAAKGGFVSVRRAWVPGDAVTLDLAMPVETVRAHANVADDAGCVAIQRGPLVYALESVDNGPDLHRFEIDASQDFALVQARGLPRGTMAIRGRALVRERPGDELYSSAVPRVRRRVFTAIPYALWQNRGPSEMRVWIRETPPTSTSFPARRGGNNGNNHNGVNP